MSRIVMLMFALYLLFLPPCSSLVDPETGADANEYNYVTVDPFFLPEQPGKPPFDQPDIAYSFSLLLALE